MPRRLWSNSTRKERAHDLDRRIRRAGACDYSLVGDWADTVHWAWNSSVLHLPATRLMIRTMFKSNGSGGPERVTCLHEGKRIFEGNNVGSRWSAKEQAFRGGDWQTTYWQQVVIPLDSVLSRRISGLASDAYFLSEHPGEYKCVITGGGVTWAKGCPPTK